MSTDDASAPSDTHAGASRVPAHIAIIMDGNGRWAKARGLPRAAGHERGVEALRRTVEAAGEIGVRYLTVYSFSTENWRRPAAEVNALFGLLRTFIKKDLGRLKKEGVKINVIGRREGLPDDIAMLVEKAGARKLPVPHGRCLLMSQAGQSSLRMSPKMCWPPISTQPTCPIRTCWFGPVGSTG